MFFLLLLRLSLRFFRLFTFFVTIFVNLICVYCTVLRFEGSICFCHGQHLNMAHLHNISE